MDHTTRRRTTPGSSALRRLLMLAGLGLCAASPAVFASEPCGTGTYPFPYTDVASVTDPFCPGIMEAYVTGISRGTSPTTFSPTTTVSRVQMTTFLERSFDQGLTRTSRRAALNQWWIPQTTNAMQIIDGGSSPQFCAADGADIWISNLNQVLQVQANTGKVVGTWTAAFGAEGIVVAAGKVFVAARNEPGSLYVIDPTQAPGAITTAASTLGNQAFGVAFDGTNLWTANVGPTGSVSIIAPQSYTVTTKTAGFASPIGILYDGASIWVTDQDADTLLKLDPSGAVVQTVTVGTSPQLPGFDGTNIWVPNFADNSVTVVQASTGAIVATISANATNNLDRPVAATFDGQRMLITNNNGDTVTVFKAADLSFIANVPTGSSSNPFGACSDGINFWVINADSGVVLRF